MIETINKILEHALIHSVKNVFEEMAFIDIELSNEIIFIPGKYVSINLLSPLNGMLLIQFDENLEKKISDNIFSTQNNENNYQSEDCFLEITNILTGVFIRQINKTLNSNIKFGLPSIHYKLKNVPEYDTQLDLFFNLEEFPLKISFFYDPIKDFTETEASNNFYNTLKILIVDDCKFDIEIIKTFLKDNQSYEINCANDTDSAKNLMDSFSPDIILLDIEMPKEDGISFLRKIKSSRKYKSLPVIMITSRNDENSIKDSYHAGAIDYLTKPFFKEELIAKLKIQADNLKLKKMQKMRTSILELKLINKIKEVKDIKNRTSLALSQLAESRDPETGEHLERIREYIWTLCLDLEKNSKYKNLINKEFINSLYNTCVLHDIGKVGIQDHILLKKGKLTEEESNIMKKHTVIGANALKTSFKLNENFDYFEMAHEIALYHHEKWDGSGYPEGLKGEKIPLTARIVTLVDVYDALCSKRVYKDAFPDEIVDEIMKNENGVTFDPEIYRSYLNCKEEFKKIRDNFKVNIAFNKN